MVTDYWWNDLVSKAVSMKTLSWLIIHPCWTMSPHPLWQACQGNTYQIEAATTSARLLTGRYALQANKVKFTKQSLDPTCPLCQQGTEDEMHFIINCPALEGEARARIPALQQQYSRQGQPPPMEPSEICSAILNGWAYVASRGPQ